MGALRRERVLQALQRRDPEGGWAEGAGFEQAMARLSPGDRAVLAGIIRRIGDVEAAEGEEIAEATLDQIIRSLVEG
jgi:hypothetical protein